MNKQSQWLFEAPFSAETQLFPLINSIHAQESEVSCLSPKPVKIERWGQYSSAIPPGQEATINNLADLIVSSFAQSICPPFRKVEIVGHADKDWQGEKKEMDVSFKRAMTVQQALTATVRKLWSNRKMGSPPRDGVEWRAFGKGAKNMIAPPYSVANRRVIVTLVGEGDPIPPTFNWHRAAQRGLDLLKKQPLPVRQTKRLQCLLQKVLEPKVVDAYLLYDFNVRQQVGCVSPTLTIKFLNHLKDDLGWQGVFGPKISDRDFIKNLAGLDHNIVESIRKIDEHLAVNGLAADCFKRQMQNWISVNQRNQQSIYWCYGSGQLSAL
ncbi:MAG: hypothetical protein LH702_28105 [Phormidesmis sp. CAN_BIN44]|nr:hypothetical protein [Phormidesmis sp. CAN_BIN44]